MKSGTDMRSAIDDMTRQRRELRLLAMVAGAATIGLLTLWATHVLEGPLPTVGAALTGMATACAWICADVCRRALALLGDPRTEYRRTADPDRRSPWG
jgi:hypothetical protein